MPVDFAQVQARRTRQAALTPARRGTLEAERRAQQFVQVQMGDLLQDDAWGVYRRHIEALRERVRAAQQAEEAIILGPAVGRPLLEAKLRAAVQRGYAEALTMVLALPTDLQEAAAAVEAHCARLLDKRDDPR